VLDETTHLSSWTTAAVSAAVVLGAAASFAVDPLSAINVYALAAGLSMVVVLFWNAMRLNQPAENHVGLSRNGSSLGESTEPRS
jgi:hypothetical protein